MSLEPDTVPQGKTKPLFKAPKLVDVLIQKPRNLSKCPVQTQKTPLPLIKKSSVKKKSELKKTSSESFHYWLEPGVSLPRCQAREDTRKLGAGELSSGHYTAVLVPYKEPEPTKSEPSKIPSITPSISSWKFCKEVPSTRDVIQDDSFAPSKCRFSLSVDSSWLYHEDLKMRDKDLEPSNALKQWELWVKRRKFQQNVFSKNLGRKPCDLVLNQADNYRKVVEDKILYSNARIPKADKWRGHPCRWEPETRTSKKTQGCDLQKQCADYFFVKTKLQQGIIPQMEFIGIPLAIQKEKGLVYEDSIPDFREGMPRRKRRKYCMRKMADKLKPNVIEMKELAVVGKKIQLRDFNAQEDSSKSLGEDKDMLESLRMKSDGEPSEEKTSKPSQFRLESVLCLSIQDEEIKCDFKEDDEENLNKINETYSWEVDFGVNPVGTLVEKSLRIQNRGTVVVNYEWEAKKIKQRQSLDSLKPSHREPWLFFDRNSGIFVPGQIHDLKFYHFTRKTGIRMDTWYLKTQPSLFKSGACKVFFSAIATDETSVQKAQQLTSYLNNRVGESIAKDLLELVLHQVLDPSFGLHGIEYRSLFLEKDLFEYHNLHLYYHSTVVEELKELFQQISSPNVQPEWDLSMNTLVKLFKAHSTDNLLMCKISENAKKLLRPNYISESKDKIYWMSYQVLCKMTNSIESDHDYLWNCLSPKKREEKWEENASVYGEFEENQSATDHSVSEEGEGKESTYSEDQKLHDMRLLNFVYYKNMFFMKVNLRLCEAAENIAGIIETARSLKRWGKK